MVKSSVERYLSLLSVGVVTLVLAVSVAGAQDKSSDMQGMQGMQGMPSGTQDKPPAMQGKAKIDLTTDPSPARKGSNTVRVKLTNADGKPISGAEVSVTFFMAAMPSMNMPEMKTVIKGTEKGAGVYEGKGDLGYWNVGRDRHRKTKRPDDRHEEGHREGYRRSLTANFVPNSLKLPLRLKYGRAKRAPQKQEFSGDA